MSGSFWGGAAQGLASALKYGQDQDELELKRQEFDERKRNNELDRQVKELAIADSKKKSAARDEIASAQSAYQDTTDFNNYLTSTGGGNNAAADERMLNVLKADRQKSIDAGQPVAEMSDDELRSIANKYYKPSGIKADAGRRYDLALQQSDSLMKAGDFEAARKLRKEADEDAAGAAIMAIKTGDSRLLSSISNAFPNGFTHGPVQFVGDSIVGVGDDGTKRSIKIKDAQDFILSKIDPMKAMTLRANFDQKDEMASLRRSIETMKDATKREIAQGNQDAAMERAMARIDASGAGKGGSKGSGGNTGSALKSEDAKFYGTALESVLGDTFKGNPLYSPAQRYMAEIVSNNPDVGRNQLPRLAEDSANIADIQAWQAFNSNPDNKGKTYVSPRGNADMAKLAARYKLDDELDPVTGMTIKTYTSAGDGNGIDPVKYRMSGNRPLPDSMVESFTSQLGNRMGWQAWDKSASDLVSKYANAKTRAELVSAFSAKFGNAGQTVLQNYLKAAKNHVSKKNQLRNDVNIGGSIGVTEDEANAREAAAMRRAEKERDAYMKKNSEDESSNQFNYGN